MVRGLVLVSPAGSTIDAQALHALKANVTIRTTRDARLPVNRLFPRWPWLGPVLAPYVHATYSRPSVQQVVGSVSMRHMFSIDELASLRTPTLLLWGRLERLLTADDLARFRAHLPPDVRVVDMDGLGHGAVLDGAHGIAEHVLAFARQLSPGAR